MHQGSYHGLDDDGRTVAQVGHVIGPAGTSLGWLAQVVGPEANLSDYYRTQEDAQAAAEAVLAGG